MIYSFNLSNLKILLFVIFFSVPRDLFKYYLNISELKPYDVIAALIISLLIIDLYQNKFVLKVNYNLIFFPFLYICWSILFSFKSFEINSFYYGIRFIELLFLTVIIQNMYLNDIQKIIFFTFIISIFWLLVELIFMPEYIVNWRTRFTAQYTGPFELASIFLLFFLFYRKKTLKILSFFITVITNTKAIFLSYFVIFLNKIRYIHLIFFITPLGFLLFFYENSSIRIFDLFTLDKLNFDIFNLIPTSNNHKEYINFFYQRNLYSFTGDASTDLRISTYIGVFKSLDLISFFIGNGPGYYGKAVDSSVIRIYCEGGLFMFIAFSIYLKELLNVFKSKLVSIGILILFLTVDLIFSLRFIILFILIYSILNNQLIDNIKK